MGMYDCFVGELRCPKCGYISRDSSSNMQTKIARRPYLRELSIGDSIDADWGDVSSAGYLRITEPTRPDTVVILEMWDCPSCGKAFNWARIGIVEGKIELVESVELSGDIVRAANYISEDCRFFVEEPERWETIVEAFIERLNGERRTT